MEDWVAKFDQEISTAQAARARGNEGMARVCARRAAGLAAGEYLIRHGMDDPALNAFERLQILAGLDSLPAEIRQVAGHFLLRITPEYRLPVDADLIAEALWLKDKLT